MESLLNFYQEGDLKKLRNIKIHEELKDREASLLRAKTQASMEDGISWGMAEDAPEDINEVEHNHLKFSELYLELFSAFIRLWKFVIPGNCTVLLFI